MSAAPQHWAEPVVAEGLETLNCYKVDDRLYRGAQPSKAQLQALKALGVRTVVNLRRKTDDGETCRRLGLDYVAIPMSPYSANEEQITAALEIIGDADRAPVYIYCHRGADRTGAICAAYRIIAQGWEKDDAIREYTKGGYGHSPFFQNLVRLVRTYEPEGDEQSQVWSTNTSEKIRNQ